MRFAEHTNDKIIKYKILRSKVDKFMQISKEDLPPPSKSNLNITNSQF